MVGIILVGHGGMAKALLESAELILGPQENVVALSLEPSEDPASLVDGIRSAGKQLGTQQLVVLADLFGGSPANAAASVWAQGLCHAIVSGLNLPMLLEVLAARGAASAEEVARIAVRAGREGVRDVVAALGLATPAQQREGDGEDAD